MVQITKNLGFIPRFMFIFSLPLNNPFLINGAYFKGFLRDCNIFTDSNLPAIKIKQLTQIYFLDCPFFSSTVKISRVGQNAHKWSFVIVPENE